MSIWNWAHLLAAPAEAHRVSLGEGSTPVTRADRIGAAAGLRSLWLKLESGNPTGSYKDRFAASAISHMRSAGQRRCVATSSGNTGAALAAYCAVAQVACHVAVVETAPAGKLIQMLAYGAHLYRVRGFGLDPEVTRQTLSVLAERGSRPDAALQISAYCHSPAGMEGVQTLSYELADQIPAIENVFVPAGGGGLAWGVARGFQQLVRNGRLSRPPSVHCVQPAGNATIAGPLREGLAHAQRVNCTTRISGLQVPVVLDGDDVIVACRAWGGNGYLVSDDEVFAAQCRLAREEGVFCEPAGATALAGALQAVRRGEIAPDAATVCVVTGSGFKDMASVEAFVGDLACPLLSLDQLGELL